jgi:hypothetical protein
MPDDDPLVKWLLQAWTGVAALTGGLDLLERGPDGGESAALGACWSLLRAAGMGKRGR